MGLEEKIPSGFLLTTVEKLAGYMRKNSLWPATFGLACCAIEMMAVGSAAKYDIARFGSEVFRASPRQADLMIVAGRVSNKMAPVLRQIYAILRGEHHDDDGRWGTAWLYDGDHNWEIEDDHVCVLAPVKIDLVDADGYGDSAVLEENVQPYDPD